MIHIIENDLENICGSRRTKSPIVRMINIKSDGLFGYIFVGIDTVHYDNNCIRIVIVNDEVRQELCPTCVKEARENNILLIDKSSFIEE